MTREEMQAELDSVGGALSILEFEVDHFIHRRKIGDMVYVYTMDISEMCNRMDRYDAKHNAWAIERERLDSLDPDFKPAGAPVYQMGDCLAKLD